MDNRIVDVLINFNPFNTLDRVTLAEIAPRLHQSHYQAGDYVFRQGEPSLGFLFLIISGMAEVTVTSDRGLETVVGYRRPNDFFGETAFLKGSTYSGSVRARESLDCLAFPREVFEHLLQQYPKVSRFFDQMLLERMRSLYEEIVNEQSYEAYGSSESSLFRKRVSELMSSPVITCQTSETVTEVARRMSEKNISALVVLDKHKEPVGIITEKDLVTKLIALPRNPMDCTAQDVMDTKLITLPPQAYLHQGLIAVIKGGVKHLAVVEHSKLVGIVTLMDLVKARSTGTLWVVRNIETQQDISGLEKAGREVDLLLSALVAEKAPVPVIFEIMSEMHERLTRQVIILCEDEMESEGFGPPPLPYCWLNLGSAGRHEQTLRTDQDNAIVYAEPPPNQAQSIQDYFLRLGHKVVEGLARCGFAKCKGGVMASRPEWCRPLSGWQKTLEQWIRRLDPSEVRALTIFLDFRSVYGEADLAKSLWGYFWSYFRSSNTASHLLATDELQYRPPLGFRNNIITEKSGSHKDEINLKSSATIHVTNCIRIFALNHGITETSTLSRLRGLIEQEAIDQDEAEYFQAAFEAVMMFRIRENLRKHQLGESPDNYINPNRLSKRERAILRESLAVIIRLQKLTEKKFTYLWRL